MHFKNVMQSAQKPEESLTNIHFKTSKVNSTAVMLVLMQITFCCNGLWWVYKYNNTSNNEGTHYLPNETKPHILDLHAEFLDGNLFIMHIHMSDHNVMF